MDDLREIILTLDSDDKREFRYFLNRIKQKRHRKDVALFDILQEGKEYRTEYIMQKLYKSQGKEAYYALRKRLYKQLMDFVILKSRVKDTTAVSTVTEYINLSQYLYDQNRERLSFKYLKKARVLAEEIEHYELLNAIYNLMIDKMEWEQEKDLMEVISFYQKNKILLERAEKVSIANSIIRHQLIAHQKEARVIDFDTLIAKVFSDLGVDNETLLTPRELYKLMSLSRNAIIAKKEYVSFEPFIIGKYNELLETGGFTDKMVFYQLGLLYFVAHTLYRNKKFDEAKKYLTTFDVVLSGKGNSYFVFYYPKYMQLCAAVSLFSRELDVAHHFLQNLLEHKQVNLKHADRLNILINQGIYYFLDKNFVAAHRVLLSINHTDKWCEKQLGKEWVLKKNLMEVMLYVEMEKTDIAESRLRSIERTYKNLFKHPVYQRVKGFLSLVKFVLMHPHEVGSEKFHAIVDSTIDWQTFAQEDLQAMGFYAWIKAKMQQRELYEVWLELAEGKDEIA